MNKQQAAEFLGVSVRAVERYTQQGRLSVHYEPGRTRPVAVYREGELEPLRNEIAVNLYHQRPAVEKGNAANPEQGGDVGEVTALQRAGGGSPEALAVLVREVASATVGALRAEAATVPLADKLTLNLTEAAQLSGLSRAHLRAAIAEKKLKARIIGRGWRVKRSDLDAYVAKL
ncbi:MAG: helix-turn-helix domain-containing protein [Acidobacteria bacterium]|nr:helix-turn-helix domain-containing protein [Acidobacteriota bacterium]